MHISLCLTVVTVVSTSCLASAFSTLFVTEGAGEERKTEEVGTRTQKTEGNNVVEKQVIVETIPFFTDVFTKVEEVMNLTPLKVATIISAQHLINTVKSIPVSGNLPQDTLNMLSNIVDEFNKTTQIIKLTAEYVNISSHYMLSSLNHFAKHNCDQEYVQNTMKTINKNFFNVISNHVKVAVREITEKSEQREMTGTDVLVSSAFHIVAAFQEMTNQVMSLEIDNTKCYVQKTSPNSEQVNIMENNETGSVFGDSKHDATHKSIKKDQALPNNKPAFTFANRGSVQDTLTLENVDKNPDLTIEIFPQQPLILSKKDNEPLTTEEVKIPESLKVAFLPEVKSTQVKNNKLNKEENIFQSQLGFSKTQNNKENKKIIKKNLQNVNDIFGIENVNPNEELTLEIFSPQNIKNSNNQEPLSKMNENNQQNRESFNVYYYPLKTSNQNQNHLPNANTNNNLRVPEDLKGHYYPQSSKTQINDNLHRETLKQVITPFKTLSLFGNSNFGNYKNIKPQQKKEYSAIKSEGSQTNYINLDDTLTIENLDRQDLTEEVFSPETFMQNGRDEPSIDIKQGNMDLTGRKGVKSSPKTELRLGDLKNGNLQKIHNHKRNNHKIQKIQSLDRELASLAVDSLSNVPPMSYESGVKNLGKRKAKKVNAHKSLSTVLMPWGKVTPQFQSSFFHKNQQKQSLCGENVEPVCGIDKNKSNFIIFLNDCQRKHHNSVYKTSYDWADMDTCVGFLLKYSSGKPTKYTNIIPQ